MIDLEYGDRLERLAPRTPVEEIGPAWRPVPTLQLRVLFVFVVLAHERRRVLHFNVTEHPTAEWTSQQIIEAFQEDAVPRYVGFTGGPPPSETIGTNAPVLE